MVFLALSSLLPIAGHEEEEDGIDFKTTDKHVEAHEPLACCRHQEEIARRAGEPCARPHIAQHADAAAQAGIYLESHVGAGHHADDHEHNVNNDEGEGAPDEVVGDYLAIDTDSKHGTRV